MILWELKNTKNWSDTWLPKLRDNKRTAKADVALIVSSALPKGVETFDLVDGVYVAHPRCAVPVALTLRQGLVELAGARTSQGGQQTKAEQVYHYLTGPRFKQRIEAIVERFKDMREDIDKERKFMAKAWAKREAQITTMIESTVGMVATFTGLWVRPCRKSQPLTSRRCWREERLSGPAARARCARRQMRTVSQCRHRIVGGAKWIAGMAPTTAALATRVWRPKPSQG